MPIYVVAAGVVITITVMWVLIHVAFYGTKRDLVILFAVAWVIVFILYMVSI
jgi:hypothetical protein